MGFARQPCQHKSTQNVCLKIFQVNKVFITFTTKNILQYFLKTIKGYKPYNIIVMSEKESLRVFPRVVNHSNSGHKIHDLFRSRVVKIVPTLVSTVPINPFQLQRRGGSCSIGHFTKQRQSMTLTTKQPAKTSLGFLFALRSPFENTELTSNLIGSFKS